MIKTFWQGLNILIKGALNIIQYLHLQLQFLVQCETWTII